MTARLRHQGCAGCREERCDNAVVFAGRVENDASAERLDSAARLWAEATAARDGDPDPGPTEVGRRRITEVLESSPDAILLTALDGDDEPVGFAAVAPAGEKRGELHYVGVKPSMWSRGIGARLLDELALVLRSRGCTHAELWVYEDNPPAVALYEKAGWRLDGPVRTHPRSGRTERHYELELA